MFQSNGGALAADKLSKSDFHGFFDLVPEAKSRPENVPSAFMDWINDPK